MSKQVFMTSILLAIGLFYIVSAYRGDFDDKPDSTRIDFSPAAFLGLADDGFMRVTLPWDFRFPDDHGRHSRYRTEWWHLAGTLRNEDNQLLGMQFIVVRVSLHSKPQDHQSRWAASEVYAGLLSITDPDSGQLHTDQRLSRAALGLADWQSRPMRLWVEDWRVEQIGSHGQALDWRIMIPADNLTLDLELKNQRPLIDVNDVAGERSNQRPPFAFYIQPRLNAKGSLMMGGRTSEVNGTVSVEHAWGELPLPGGAVARDRFTLHLHDGRELFFIRTHRADSSVAPTVSGLLFQQEGRLLILSAEEIELRPVDYWTSEDSGARYPIRWALRIPSQKIDMALVPSVENAEGMLWSPVWTGPVRLQENGGPVLGDGLIQLSGYDRR